MPYTFTNPTLEAQREQVVIATFEGDNEIAIIDAGYYGRTNYALVVASLAEEGDDVIIFEEYRDSLKVALALMSAFLRDEYVQETPISEVQTVKNAQSAIPSNKSGLSGCGVHSFYVD